MPPKRVMKLIRGNIIADGVATRIQKATYENPYFYTYERGKHKVSVSVCGYVGPPSSTSYSEILILGSHLYPYFFNNILEFVNPTIIPTAARPNTVISEFPGVTIRDFNEILKDLKNPFPRRCVSKYLLTKLTRTQLDNLPPRFNAMCVKLTQPCLHIVDSRVVRCHTGNTSTDLARWKAVFKCIAKEDGILTKVDHYTCHSHAATARKFEEVMLRTETSNWPRKINTTSHSRLKPFLKEVLTQEGHVTIPLSGNHVKPYMNHMATYLHHLMNWPDHIQPLNAQALHSILHSKLLPDVYMFRNVRHLQSKHIPIHNGRTRYGHYCTPLATLFKDVQPIVSQCFSILFPGLDSFWVTTVEIVVQA